MNPSDNAKRILVLTLLSFSIALILWITLFFRVGRHARDFVPPLSSYRYMGRDLLSLLEIIGNIILFLPVGLTATLVLRLDFWKAAVLGIVFSLLIESCQWILWLGSFSLDDVINNSLGTVIGALLISKSGPPQWIDSESAEKKRNVVFLSAMTVLFALFIFILQSIFNMRILPFLILRFFWRFGQSFRH